MKRIGILAAFLVGTMAPSSAHAADASVTISGNGEGSTSRVEIRNSVSSDSKGSSVTKSHTKVTVESNGKVTTYETDEPESVDVRSEDGKATVRVGNRMVSPSVTPVPTIPIQSIALTPSPAPPKPKMKTPSEMVAEFFKKLFSSLRLR